MGQVRRVCSPQQTHSTPGPGPWLSRGHTSLPHAYVHPLLPRVGRHTHVHMYSLPIPGALWLEGAGSLCFGSTDSLQCPPPRLPTAARSVKGSVCSGKLGLRGLGAPGLPLAGAGVQPGRVGAREQHGREERAPGWGITRVLEELGSQEGPGDHPGHSPRQGAPDIPHKAAPEGPQVGHAQSRPALGLPHQLLCESAPAAPDCSGPRPLPRTRH